MAETGSDDWRSVKAFEAIAETWIEEGLRTGVSSDQAMQLFERLIDPAAPPSPQRDALLNSSLIEDLEAAHEADSATALRRLLPRIRDTARLVARQVFELERASPP
jgi:hypothetical protein